MNNKIKVAVLSLLLIGSSVINIFADKSGSYGPSNSLRWNDAVRYLPYKSTWINSWDPLERSGVERKTRACLGVWNCISSNWESGSVYASAYIDQFTAKSINTSYTYKWWRYR